MDILILIYHKSISRIYELGVNYNNVGRRYEFFYKKKFSGNNYVTKPIERMIVTDKRNYSEKEKKQFRKYADDHAPKRNLLKDCLMAFLVGGGICTIGQGLFDIYSVYLAESNAKTLVSVSLIFLSCLLTGSGVYDSIAKKAGAGTLVPITGFANAVCSPAIDSKAEGFIFGTGSKMFVIAGPVIVYGTAASVVYGIIYWITTLF